MSTIKQELKVPLTGIVFLASLFIVMSSHFGNVDFGTIGILAWIVVIFGVGYFVIWVIAQFFG